VTDDREPRSDQPEDPLAHLIDRLLIEADSAASSGAWDRVTAIADDIRAVAPDNQRAVAMLERARNEGLLEALPDNPRQLHFRIDPHLGELAPLLGQSPRLYRQLRPEALALLLYLAARVHEISGAATPLTVTSAVRDDAYQQLVVEGNPEATTGYSLHTTGYAFDLLRHYGSTAQAQALQYELDRLQALDLIAWVREPADIHITVASQAGELIPAVLKPAA